MADTVRTPAALIALLSDGAAAHSTNRQMLRDLLVSIPSHAGVVNVKEPRFGALGDGSNDDTAAIVAADTAAGSERKSLLFPPGIYKTSSTLVVRRTWIGTPVDLDSIGTVIKPTNAIATMALDLQSEGFLHGIYLDGSSTTGKIGVGIGTASIANHLGMIDCQVRDFTGVGGRGIKLAFCVDGMFYNVYASGSYINLHSLGFGGGPTTCFFDSCKFRGAVTKGVWIENGYGIRFYNPTFEANGEEGLYFQNTGDSAVEVGIEDPWYEGNWTSVASGAPRHAQYHLFVDGATGPAGTIRVFHKNGKFDEGATAARAMHLTNATGFVDLNSKVANEAGQILFDGTSAGNFEAWNGQNGSFLTTVTNTSGGAWSSRSHLEDNIEAAWTGWTPTITGSGSMTISSPVITKARYKIIGKTITVAVSISFTTATAGGATVNITLPTNVRSLDANGYDGVWIDDGTYKAGYIRPDGANPTSSIKIGRLDAAVWTLGAGRAATFTRTFELF